MSCVHSTLSICSKATWPTFQMFQLAVYCLHIPNTNKSSMITCFFSIHVGLHSQHKTIPSKAITHCYATLHNKIKTQQATELISKKVWRNKNQTNIYIFCCILHDIISQGGLHKMQPGQTCGGKNLCTGMQKILEMSK